MTSSKPIDYGPLAALIGTWRGDKGMDVAPDPDGIEENPYFETLTFVPVGDVTNANTQLLVGLRYQQSVSRKSNNLVFHDQVGYWMWDAATETVMQSLLIPRAVGVLASGRWKGPASPLVLEVATPADGADSGIVQSPFMRENARTASGIGSSSRGTRSGTTRRRSSTSTASGSSTRTRTR